MGEHQVEDPRDPEELRVFMQRLLDDVRALDRMLENGIIESGVTRIGAEQELFLIDDRQRPAPRADELLKALDDPHFTTELARFNLEFNLDPLDVTPRCLSELHRGIDDLLAKARHAARGLGFDVLMTGILPTLEKADMSLDNMAPVPRYFALNRVIRELRGRDFRVHISGRDELSIRHDNVMLEACNTSFQIHLQVAPERFAMLYNVAQAVAAPVMAAAVGSPLLFGRRLWHETRIALFQQSLDTRQSLSHRRAQHPRVSFGERWVDDSVLEIFQEDISRFRLLLTTELGEDPLDALDRGVAPDLKALRMHNGTVYRWNRPCYGVAGGIPHLRIENRMLPAGPTVIDEVANAAFWFGLVKALADDIPDVRRALTFDTVRRNFQNAARHGLDAQFHWLDGRVCPARDLLLDELLLRARDGLAALGVDAEDRDRYLGVIEAQVSSCQRPAVRLTEALRRRQEVGEPVHTWPIEGVQAGKDPASHVFQEVSGLMTTDLFTVTEDDVVDLAAALMDWRHIRHVPVENTEHQLVGLLTHRTLMRVLARSMGRERRPIPVREVMQRNLVTVGPATPTLDAMTLMEKHGIACLPVVEDGRLVGILTERDLIRVAKGLMTHHLTSGTPVSEHAKEGPSSNVAESADEAPEAVVAST